MPAFKIALHQQWVLPLSLIFLILLLAIVEIPMLRISNGQVIYPLDDTYIRMATARNLAEYGVWGESPHEFVSASSSILYPLLLAACFKIFGPQLIISLLINLAAALGFIIVLQRWLQKQNLPPFCQLLICLAIIYLAPLHVIVAYGMEHTLQILLSLLFILGFCSWLSDEKSAADNNPAPPWNLYLYGLLLTATRYEGLFLIAYACVALLLKRKWSITLILASAGLLPLVLFGIYSMAHDGYFIPNSILIKSMPLPLDVEHVSKFFREDVVNKLLYPYPSRGAVATGRLLILLPLVYWHYYSSLRTNKIYRNILSIILATTILHLVFSNANFFYRYEAYLVACGLVVPAVLLLQQGVPLSAVRKGGGRWIVTWTIVFLLYPLFSRSWMAWQETGYGFVHEYQYNYQAARFLHTYYNDATVVMDEVGMVSFLSTGKKMDVMTGIVYKDVTESRLDELTRIGYLNFLIRRDKPVIALIADNKYHPWLIQSWTKVATWYTSVRLSMGGESELDIYAIEPSTVPSLRANLKTFQATMPPGIKVKLY